MDIVSTREHNDRIEPNRGLDRVIKAAMAATLLTLGCTPGESNTTNAIASGAKTGHFSPLIESVALIPEAPTSEDGLTAVVRVPRRDSAEVEITIDWVVNGTVIGTGGPGSQPPGRFSRGDRVYVVVRARHGEERATGTSPEVAIHNARPAIRTAIVDPLAPTTLDSITGSAEGADSDGDPIDYQWRWYRNGVPIPEQITEVLPPRHAAKGDTIIAEVRAFDGEAHSKWVRARGVVVQNAAPTIRIEPAFSRGADGVYRSTLSAEDPDGDRGLRYRMRRGPRGMHLDPLSGVLSWDPQVEDRGSHPVEVSVSDPEGAESTLNITATMDGSVDETPANGASVQ